MRRGRVDPMALVALGAVVFCGLVFSCYRAMSGRLLPSIVASGASKRELGYAVNLTRRDMFLNAMVVDSMVPVDSSDADSLARVIARWSFANFADTVGVEHILVTLFRNAPITITPTGDGMRTYRFTRQDLLDGTGGERVRKRDDSASPDSASPDSASSASAPPDSASPDSAPPDSALPA